MPRVLVIGLDPHRLPGPWDPQPIADAIEAGLAKFAEHGVEVQSCLVGLDGSEDIEQSITNALTTCRWDCVVVGGGFRDPSLLRLFERVLNLVRTGAPDAAIALNDTPAETFEAASRWLT